MAFDFTTLSALQKNHPTWRLVSSPHAPLIASFLHHVFIASNVRVMAQADLAEALEDELFVLRQQLGEEAFPKPAIDYLNDWASQEKSWLRKFYPKDSDEVQFDLTPATEKAFTWLQTLTERSFVGTESRLLTLFELLRQISTGSEVDKDTRIADLETRRAEIEAEIEQVKAGTMPLLDDTALKDRFMQFNQLARELLADFREVEHNFHGLDRRVRERIARWGGNKGELLEEIMGERDSIADSDQGKSFRAFWDFLMSPQRQEEFTELLDQVLALPSVVELKPDKRTRRIHYDWLEAGEHTQRTIAQLSQQLRRFLDDQAWLENRRIMDILQGIEAKALDMRERLKEASFSNEFMAIDENSANIELPFERPLYSPPIKPQIPDVAIEMGDEHVDSSVLYTQTVIDKELLARHIRQSLQEQPQVSLSELCKTRPLEYGLAELVGYLELAADGKTDKRYTTVVDESVEEVIHWQTEENPSDSVAKQAKLPRIIYIRQAAL